MGYDDRREIFERLEAIERRLQSHRDERRGRDDEGQHRDRRDRDRDRDRRGGHRDQGDHDRRDGDFNEKRIIDTIVRLVTEQLGRVLQDQQARSRSRDDGGSEKRIIDLVVSLVSEHVQEIVATELDRRLGRPSRASEDDQPQLSPPDDPERSGSGGAHDEE